MRCEAAETNYSANCQAQRLKTIIYVKLSLVV